MSSRWADTAEDIALKEERKRAKAEKKRQKLAQKAQESQAVSTKPEVLSQSIDPTEASSFTSRYPRRITVRPNDTHFAEIRGLKPGEEAKYDMLRFEGGYLGRSESTKVYEKLNNVAEGSYGKVVRAICNATGQTVAVKKLKSEISMNRKVIPASGLREIRILKNCDNRNIVKLLDVVSANSSPVLDTIDIVLEFAAHDLYGLLKTHTPGFLPSEVKTLLHQLLSGLSYLHSHWIVHRDLKPSNILLTDKGVLKIADFGMARYLADPNPYPLTKLVTTLWYRAPEVILGARDYSFPVDLWSVGCIFAEMIMRNPLFEGVSTESSLISNIIAFCGPFSDSSYPNYRRLPNSELFKTKFLSPLAVGKNVRSSVAQKMPGLSDGALELFEGLLKLDPSNRLTAIEALESNYFVEKPKGKPEHLFPTFPSRANLEYVPER